MTDIAIFVGSKSDIDIANYTIEILTSFNISYDIVISSAHRNPEMTVQYIQKYKDVSIFIAIAGMSAQLPGFISSYTIKPVIGVPIASGTLGGIDSLLSISQMPSGVPVATVSIGKAGAINAALLAISILSLNNSEIKQKLIDYRLKMKL